MTDNAIIRKDGATAGHLQESLATIDDNGSVNIPTGETYDINGSPHTHASGGAPEWAPWLVDIIPSISDPSAVTGTWGLTNIVGENVTYPFVNATPASGGATIFYNSSAAQNDAVSWDVILSAGIWNCTIHCRKASNTGIFTLNQDGNSMGTVDSYAASAAYGKLQIIGWTVSTDGKHTIQLKMATKNGSSSGYLGELFGISLRRTS